MGRLSCKVTQKKKYLAATNAPFLRIWKKMRNFVAVMANKDDLSDKMLRLTLRVTRDRMSASVGDPQSHGGIVYDPYELNNAISPAANLREAFRKSELLESGYRRALILTDAPVMLVPAEEFSEASADTLYRYAYTLPGSDKVLWRALPNLNCVAVMAMNRDLLTVVEDHFKDIRLTSLCEPVWTHLYKRNFTGPRQKLFAYFFDRKMNVFRFGQNRFKFCNTFDAARSHDALYYLLYVWRQLGMDAENDELHLVGNIADEEWLCGQLASYLRRVVCISPQVEFRNIAMAADKTIPYDLKAVYLDEEGWQSTVPPTATATRGTQANSGE